jgi:hypothetical protein
MIFHLNFEPALFYHLMASINLRLIITDRFSNKEKKSKNDNKYCHTQLDGTIVTQLDRVL